MSNTKKQGSCPLCGETHRRQHENYPGDWVCGTYAIGDSYTEGKVCLGNRLTALSIIVSMEKIPERDGGGWLATIPVLGEQVFCAAGKTQEEAAEHLNRVLLNKVEAYRAYGSVDGN